MLLLFSNGLGTGQAIGNAVGTAIDPGIAASTADGSGSASGTGTANGVGASGGGPQIIEAEYAFVSAGTSKWNFRLPKFEGESFGISIDFGGRLGQNDSVQSLQVKVWDSNGIDQTGSMLGDSGLSGSKGLALVQAGTAPMAYVVDFTVTTQQGHRLEDNVTLYVMSDKLN